MSNSRPAFSYLKHKREIEDREERKTETSRRKVLFVTASLQALVVTIGILLIFRESFQDWEMLPPVAGVGLGLYGGVGLVIALLWALVFYNWYRMRQPL